MAENHQTIRLPKGIWQFDLDSQLGEAGGFGAVFAGVPAQENFAVKRLSLNVGDLALREVDVASDLEGKDFTNVLPVWDAGQDAETGRYFIVMPKAEKSLKDDIDDRK